MSRRERELTILRLVQERSLHTQAEVVEALAAEGITVTQATVSRDIKRLGLVKVPTPDGAYRYAPPEALERAPAPTAQENLRSAFQEFVVELDSAQGILVIRTYSGCANAVAVAIDEADVPGVVGTLAGDDTIFVLPRTAEEVAPVMEAFEELLRA